MRRSSAAMSLSGLLCNTALDPAFGCSEESDSLMPRLRFVSAKLVRE